MTITARNRICRRVVDERGLTESVQWAVIMPLVLVMALGGIQAGIVLHGRQVVGEAARAAAEAESAYGAPAGAGRHAARAIAEVAGLRGIEVGVATTHDRVDATVSARVPIFLDVGQGQVRARASAPVERVTAPGGGT